MREEELAKLRDEIAMRAMQSMIANHDIILSIRALSKEVKQPSDALLAKGAYDVADSMLEARKTK